jgi:hypothetical protein|nr:MAG TPA: hypothetical protein [Caudoviricetes sp.]
MGAKYQKGLDKTKEFLKSHGALTIREVCEKAEIEAKDADILINRFNKRRGRLHVSYDRGQMWNKEEAIKAFTSAGYPQATEKYNEAEVYYTLNMVYSDFYPMYRENLRSYIDHAYLFLTDKDYKGRYSKAKWYARK